jgi:hypothetical protein
MHMFDAREIEDSLCNTCHECGCLYRCECFVWGGEDAIPAIQGGSY